MLLAGLAATAQVKQATTPYDEFIKRFNAKMDTVSWLCTYDNIAWWTSDSVAATSKEEQAKLGAEWFCFLDNSVWHALYGKFQNGSFETVYHYEVDSTGKVSRVRTLVDTALSNTFARALANGNRLVNIYPDSLKVRCNQYIKVNDDKTISVWFLPAFTQNSIAVYGGEFNYLFDKTGNNLISKAEFSQGYLGFKPDSKKQITLEYPTLKEPSLGGVFFAWYYRSYFDRITINTQLFSSAPFHENPTTYYWVHALKEK